MNDRAIGQRVRQARGGRTQKAVVMEMAEQGWPTWRQATLSLLEKGQRSLKLAEAVTLCKILECSLADLVTDD